MKTANPNSQLTPKKTEKDKNNSSLTPKNNMRKEISIDLIEKYANNEVLASEIKGFKKSLIRVHKDFNVGNVITFLGGYNMDIRYTAEIIGFDEEGSIYLHWDCYWSPIRNEPAREINKI